MKNTYPTNENIEQHKYELVLAMRHYILGWSNPELVRNSFQGLFTDLLLDEQRRCAKIPSSIKNSDFEKLWSQK